MTTATIKTGEPTIADMNMAIALFMGAKIDKQGRVYGLSDKGHYRAESLTYHTYWDSLMKVYEKLKSSGKYSYEMGTMKNTDFNFVVIADVKHLSKKQLVYLPSREPLIIVAHKAIYKFITEHAK
jgi:hypothetical protein